MLRRLRLWWQLRQALKARDFCLAHPDRPDCRALLPLVERRYTELVVERLRPDHPEWFTRKPEGGGS